MKKAVQYSDKYGQVVEDGKTPKARVAPGVTMERAESKVAKTMEKAETKAVKTTSKATAKVEKKAAKTEDTSDNK